MEKKDAREYLERFSITRSGGETVGGGADDAMLCARVAAFVRAFGAPRGFVRVTCTYCGVPVICLGVLMGFAVVGPRGRRGSGFACRAVRARHDHSPLTRAVLQDKYGTSMTQTDAYKDYLERGGLATNSTFRKVWQEMRVRKLRHDSYDLYSCSKCRGSTEGRDTLEQEACELLRRAHACKTK